MNKKERKKEPKKERKGTKLKFSCFVLSSLTEVSGNVGVDLTLEKQRDVV